MTEGEAKTKWCPFARVGSGVNGLGAMNRDAIPPKDTPELVANAALCIGSACMAWREEPPPPEVVGPIHGFCGLAGRPA